MKAKKSEIMLFVGENFKFKLTKSLKDRLLNHNALFTVAAISLSLIVLHEQYFLAVTCCADQHSMIHI